MRNYKTLPNLIDFLVHRQKFKESDVQSVIEFLEDLNVILQDSLKVANPKLEPWRCEKFKALAEICELNETK